MSVHADIKSVTENTSREALKRCRVQSKYAGRVTDVHKGIVYVRLSNGVNAVAHSCYDRRTPGKKDDVSFVVTKLDEERSIAVGIITRIIRQNVHPYGGCTVRVRIWQWQFHFAFCMELPELFIRQSHHAVLRIEEKPIRS